MQHFNLGTWCISSALVHLGKMSPLSRSVYDHFITVGIFSSRKCAKLQQNRWPPAKLFCNLNSAEMLILVSTSCLCCWSRSLIEIQTSVMAILYSCDLNQFLQLPPEWLPTVWAETLPLLLLFGGLTAVPPKSPSLYPTKWQEKAPKQVIVKIHSSMYFSAGNFCSKWYRCYAMPRSVFSFHG